MNPKNNRGNFISDNLNLDLQSYVVETKIISRSIFLNQIKKVD